MKRTVTAFSLLEMLIVIAIVSLITTIASAYWAEIHQAYLAKKSISQLNMLLHSARQQAVFTQTNITVCPSIDQQFCSQDWNHPLIMFNDVNQNSKLDPDEALYTMAPASSTFENRTFNGHKIGFNALGMSHFNNGTLRYCLKSKKEYKAKFIISRLGRIRTSNTVNATCF